MKNKIRIFVLFLFLIGFNLSLSAQKNIINEISDSLTLIANSYTSIGKVSIISFAPNSRTGKIVVKTNDRFAYMPFRADNVKRIYKAIKKITAGSYSGYDITCQVDNKNIEDLIPNFYKSVPDKQKQFSVTPLVNPLVRNKSLPYNITNGLEGRNIALWQSHGWYYDQKRFRWEWQRARVLQVIEDLYTQSYVLPYLAPMLENAGASVLLPRERDTQVHEVIVDNDSKDGDSKYKERNDRKSWKTGEGNGFQNKKKFYVQNENPFTMGTFREIESVTDDDESSRCEWIPNIPEEGDYAVYVSYKMLENSSQDARYSVIHKGVKTDFSVNQSIFGGTWLYLGTFGFNKGRNNTDKVILTNFSSEDGKIITADAVKFGGGMGNIARNPAIAMNGVDSVSGRLLNDTSKNIVYEPVISRYPRFTEAARYWLQWAGMPDSIYSKNKGVNDYVDDIQCRGMWVNYLAGGSVVAPNLPGLHVPVDLSFAFHTDAGTTKNDSIIGTLGICSIPNSDGKTEFSNGISRLASRDLVDLVQSQIVNDVQSLYAPEWTRRGLWNKSYSESRVPEVPAMLLELLSHQNFADMRYGLDPRFRFSVSRAIYKGILKYISSANGLVFTVQPLPVKQFSCRFIDNNKLELHWVAVNDTLEPTAHADKYVLYTRIDNGEFDNGRVVNSNRLSLTLQTGKIYSFKVTALNKGGESFPSEILSACRSAANKGEVLIVNGFDRLSAPVGFTQDSTAAGFLNDDDPGVPYLKDISFVGKQFEFKRNKPWIDDDAPGFGASYSNYETKVIAGNSFDYPFLHGKAIKNAGYSFVSCSELSVVSGDVDLNQYKIVDMILGKQKKTFIGNAKKAPEFKTFPLALQQSIRSYCDFGGNLFVSGAFIGSDLLSPNNPDIIADKSFIENVLKYKFITAKASVGGNVRIVNSPVRLFKKSGFEYFAEPNMTSYYVESPDAIEPDCDGAYTICRYSESNMSAAVAYSGNYKVCSFGFPFETIQSEKDRTKIMTEILAFFNTGIKK